MLSYIDIFSGCGGLSEGFEKNGLYKLKGAVDWDISSVLTLRKRLSTRWNIKDSTKRVMHFDIQDHERLFGGWDDDFYGMSDGFDFLIKNKKVDVVIGGPPCQAYSLAGRIQDAHGMKNDYRNHLFRSYVEVVKRYTPKLFVFENVLGLLTAKTKNGSVLEEINESFKKSGYTISCSLREDAIVNSADYGVPQVRKRLIIVGLSNCYFSRSDKVNQDLLRSFYKILGDFKVARKKTIKDSIWSLPKLEILSESKRINKKKFSHKPCKERIKNHVPRFHNRRDIEIFSKLAKDKLKKRPEFNSTDSLKKLYTEVTGKKSNIHKYFVLPLNGQSNTIVAHLSKDGLRHIHPDWKQGRTITVRECARLQSFPDSFEFLGNQSAQYKQVGNAVSPKVSEVIAKSIYHFLERHG